MQTLSYGQSLTKTCKKCGLLFKCSSAQDAKIHKRICQPYIILKSGTTVQHFYDKQQKTLDGKFIISKKCKKILHSKVNKRIYEYVRDLQGAIDFEYSGMLNFVDAQHRLLGALIYQKLDCKVVIHHIWVHTLNRRKKIGTRLVGALENYLNCSKCDIYCTDLTQEGKGFFNSYFNGDKINIYSV